MCVAFIYLSVYSLYQHRYFGEGYKEGIILVCVVLKKKIFRTLVKEDKADFIQGGYYSGVL